MSASSRFDWHMKRYGNAGRYGGLPRQGRECAQESGNIRVGRESIREGESMIKFKGPKGDERRERGRSIAAADPIFEWKWGAFVNCVW